MKQWICIVFALLLECGGDSSLRSGNPLIPGCATYNLVCPNPGVGQWATAFGQNNKLVGTSFPMQSGSGIHYVYTAPSSLALGKTMTLNYTISGNGTLTAQPNDTDPPTISLFIWEKGDDLSCGGSTPSTAGPMRYYRQLLTVRPHIEIDSADCQCADHSAELDRMLRARPDRCGLQSSSTERRLHGLHARRPIVRWSWRRTEIWLAPVSDKQLHGPMISGASYLQKSACRDSSSQYP